MIETTHNEPRGAQAEAADMPGTKSATADTAATARTRSNAWRTILIYFRVANPVYVHGRDGKTVQLYAGNAAAGPNSERGGGIAKGDGTLAVGKSPISGNSTNPGTGGSAIFNVLTASVSNSTSSRNTSPKASGSVLKVRLAETRDELAGRGMAGQIAHKGEKAPIYAGQRWPVERTNAWHNAFSRLQRCYERREEVIDAFFDLADTIITVRSLIRQAWTTYRWDDRPARRP
jgi:hypothetical protein